MSTSKTITRTDLTNILNEVLPVQAGLKTTEVTSGNISLTILKSGGVVQVFSFGSFPATNDGVTIVTIPEGFRPKQTTDYTVFDVNGVRLGTLRFFSDGRVVPTFGNLTAGNVRACWTYISSADYIPADADIVVEQGTSGIWTYRKWNSGIAEAWGRKSDASLPSGWSSGDGVVLILPFTFKTITGFSVQHQNYQVDNIYMWPKVVNETYDAISIQTHTTAAITNAVISVIAKGTWK